MIVGGEMFCPLNLEKTLSDRNSLVITLPPTIAAPKMMFISEVRTKNVARTITIVVKNDEKNFCLSMSYAPLFLGFDISLYESCLKIGSKSIRGNCYHFP